ncbi:MAG: nucleoside hydrolase [Clostridia bacterium]|nr:nucleoside hydrolase [Clostridia bacterium]
MYHDFDMEKILNHIKTTPKKNFILDTDTFNEIDDQFAVTLAMTAEDLNLLGLCAAPFHNQRSSGPADGMEKSYQELLKLRQLIDPEDKMHVPCYRGSDKYMDNIITPVKSDAAENLVRLVNEADDIVYIGVVGCFTNVASALLLDPSIINKAVIILLGGNLFENIDANDFNLVQDRIAARVIFDCGVPVVLLPAMGGSCTDIIHMTNAEVTYYFKDKAGAIGNYLCKIFYDDECEPEEGEYGCNTRQRSIFDIAAPMFARVPDNFVYTIVPARTIDGEGMYREVNDGRKMIYVPHADRNAVLSDFFTTVKKFTTRNA